MKRWLPFPVFASTLFVTWLLLNESTEPAHLLLGIAIAVAGGRMLAALQPPVARRHTHTHTRIRPGTVIALTWLVFADIVRSNLAVGRIALRPERPGRVTDFIEMPLELRHPGGLAILACIVTATPGTSWARYDAARNVVTIHVLDLIDEQAWIRQFKERYERRLREIFE